MLDTSLCTETEPQRERFRRDVLAGLSARPKQLPSRWFYDERGSVLFEEITQLGEYYLSRTEAQILRDNAAALARFAGPDRPIVEYGAGSAIKSELLIAAATPPQYVPVDISGEFLAQTAGRLRQRFPAVQIMPVVADFTADFVLPASLPGSRTIFFPGSTIGNLDRATTLALLRRMHGHGGADGRAIIGADLVKPREILIPAYDDARGVTAAFNCNLLVRINRELDADFVVERFRHEARWNAAEAAIEMHLVSTAAQQVRVAGQTFTFAADETIHTETSRKYEVATFGALAAEAEWSLSEVWTDASRKFAIFGLTSA